MRGTHRVEPLLILDEVADDRPEWWGDTQVPKQSKVIVGRTSGMPRNVQKLLDAAATFMHGSTDERAAIRRAARTSDWRHDPERLAAADAKRERRRQRNLKCL